MFRRTDRTKLLAMSIACAALIAGEAAHASGTSYTGPVFDIRTNPSQYTAGYIRASIQTNTATSCPNFGWYSFDQPPAPVGSVWIAILLAAIHDGHSVTISGTGNCDPYGFEIVNYIDAL